jgi:hypothetical protein
MLRTLRFSNVLKFTFCFIQYMRNYFPANPSSLLLVYEIWGSSRPFTRFEDVYLSTSFTSPLDGCELSASRPRCFTPWGRTLNLSRRTRLCGLQREAILARARIIISDIPTHILVNILTTIIQLPYATRLVKKFVVEVVQSGGRWVTLRNTSQLCVLSELIQGWLDKMSYFLSDFENYKILWLGIVLTSHYTHSLSTFKLGIMGSGSRYTFGSPFQMYIWKEGVVTSLQELSWHFSGAAEVVCEKLVKVIVTEPIFFEPGTSQNTPRWWVQAVMCSDRQGKGKYLVHFSEGICGLV